MTDTDIIELFRERVAIMVIDGGVNEAEANKVAFYETARLVGVEPRAMPQVCKQEMKEAVSKLTKV
ncbi:hypothetical protein VN12_02005 [Pirellula sp. SH-Sr6A]|uniref:hypothetical protein n=1 Tax=Pirellula sp. SH-Sr6A TaxID=1632865 RepID=UPI00078C5F6D|nr:hypothetical protein [Pirellula sp. SH-Sr6A]AMV30860.1 hypothetical protein VN12_02005 [Pirellula sp. SH-Sr6A]